MQRQTNRQTKQTGEKQKETSIKTDRERERIEKEQPTQMKPHERKANESIKVFQQKSRDRHTSMRQQTFKGTHQEDVAKDRTSRQGRKT